MAKARSSRKSGPKARKVGKAKAAKGRTAKARRPKPARGPAKAQRKPAAVGSVVRERKVPPPPVEIPEIPPPLPAPIASFTF